jgi:hypothetical protein
MQRSVAVVCSVADNGARHRRLARQQELQHTRVAAPRGKMQRSAAFRVAGVGVGVVAQHKDAHVVLPVKRGKMQRCKAACIVRSDGHLC